METREEATLVKFMFDKEEDRKANDRDNPTSNEKTKGDPFVHTLRDRDDRADRGPCWHCEEDSPHSLNKHINKWINK